MAKRNYCKICGNEKDIRARACKSCSMKKSARKQWANPSLRSKRLLIFLRAAKKRRRTFDKIYEDSAWQYKKDGRAYIWYWKNGRRGTIYRYQWNWIIHNGEIPNGYIIHHIDGNRANDRIENLLCVTRQEHIRLHRAEIESASFSARGLKAIPKKEKTAMCEFCGKSFEIKTRVKSNRFCSHKCYWSWMKK